MKESTVTFEQVPVILSELRAAIEELTNKVDNLARTSGEISDRVLKDNLVNGKRILNIDQAAKMLGKAKTTIYRYAEQGRLPSSKRNGCLYFIEDDLLKWVESGKKRIYDFR